MKTKKERVFGTTTGLERLAYAFGDLGSNFVWTFCSSFLTLYSTDSVLVSAGLVGTLLLICRIFDCISDIFAGVLIEKTRTKRGKARPWFGATIIPLVIIELLVFHVPTAMAMGAKIAWIIVSSTWRRTARWPRRPRPWPAWSCPYPEGLPAARPWAWTRRSPDTCWGRGGN